MTTKTKATSLEVLTEALTLHGWSFTTENGEVTVKDTSVDLAPRWHSRPIYGTKQVPGIVVRFTNGVQATSHYDSEVFGVAKFTYTGSLVEITGGYPLSGKGTSLSKTLGVLAEQGPAEIERRRSVRAEQREVEAATKIAQADAKVAEAHEAFTATLAQAVPVLEALRHDGYLTTRALLDVLNTNETLRAYRIAEADLEMARRQADSARAEYARLESNGWQW